MNETTTISLTTQNDGHIAVLTLNRPQAMNALNQEAMEAFVAAVESLHTLDALRVVILRGAGEQAFCSGGDLFELSQLTTEEEALAFISLMGDALRRLELLPFPVIAAVNGFALGGGSEIALACDIRIVDEAVRFGFVQSRMALTPGWGAGQRLLRAVGYPKALELFALGKILKAEEVRELGLASEVVPTGQAFDHALRLAEQIANQAPEVMRGIKALLRAGLEHPYEQALQIEREIFPPLWVAQPHMDAVQAFLRQQQQKKGQAE